MTTLEASAAALSCLSAIVAGVALLAGLAWALIAAGTLGLLITVLLVDPKAKRGRVLSPQEQATRRWAGGKQ